MAKGYHLVQLMQDNPPCNAMMQMQDPEIEHQRVSISSMIDGDPSMPGTMAKQNIQLDIL